MRPDLSRASIFSHNYITLVPETEMNSAFAVHTDLLLSVIDSIPPDKHEFRYGPDKWTVKEVLQHLMDAERIFVYRALCFARQDPGPFPSFDENEYARHSKAGKRSWTDLVEELRLVRASTRLLFASFDEEQLESGGISSDQPSYVRAIGYTLLGHGSHHVNILRERYLPA